MQKLTTIKRKTLFHGSQEHVQAVLLNLLSGLFLTFWACDNKLTKQMLSSASDTHGSLARKNSSKTHQYSSVLSLVTCSRQVLAISLM